MMVKVQQTCSTCAHLEVGSCYNCQQDTNLCNIDYEAIVDPYQEACELYEKANTYNAGLIELPDLPKKGSIQ